MSIQLNGGKFLYSDEDKDIVKAIHDTLKPIIMEYKDTVPYSRIHYLVSTECNEIIKDILYLNQVEPTLRREKKVVMDDHEE